MTRGATAREDDSKAESPKDPVVEALEKEEKIAELQKTVVFE